LIHSALNVPQRLKNWVETGSDFLSLRTELEILRERMCLNSEFDTDCFTAEYFSCHKRYSDGLKREPHDILRTSSLATKTQEALNVRLADIIDES